MSFQIKRAYDPAEPSDGIRVLVDRLWPRGISKAKARLDWWMKEIAPSPALRLWFDHRAERFAEFGRRYKEELIGNSAVVELRKLGTRKRVTLLYGARDPEVNHAVILQSMLRKKIPSRKPLRPKATKA
jgi:uncharacterized protein YeaO (DUF488 family)